MVQADPNLGWIKEMGSRGDVDWQRVKEVHDSFSYSSSGLSGPAAMAIAIAVAYFTAGAASGAIGAAAGAGWANAALTAAAVSAAGGAAVSTINNRGNLSNVLGDVTSKDALKGYVTSAAIAGLGSYTEGWGREMAVEGNYNLVDATERFKAYVANTALRGFLSGEDNTSTWLTIAGTGAMLELYQNSVGRKPDPRPGVDRAEGPGFDEGLKYVPKIVGREGKNIGFNLPEGHGACVSFYSICHGTPISDVLNQVPGFNSFARLHDQWMMDLRRFKGAPMNVFENLGSMLLSMLIKC